MKNTNRTAAIAIAAGLGVVLVPASRAQDKPPAIAAPVPTAEAPPEAPGQFLPDSFNPQEHASTWANPPFSRKVLPDEAGPPAPTGPTIWDGWQIAMVDRFGGEFTVGLVGKKGDFHMIKEGQTLDEEGVTLEKVESNGVIAETVLHLSGGGQTGTLTFDTKRLSVAAKGPAPAKKAPVKAAQRRVVQPAANQTQQQKAAANKANAAANQQLVNHLNSSVAPAGNNANANQGRAAAAPTPTTRTRRRSVVLPPSNK